MNIYGKRNQSEGLGERISSPPWARDYQGVAPGARVVTCGGGGTYFDIGAGISKNL